MKHVFQLNKAMSLCCRWVEGEGRWSCAPEMFIQRRYTWVWSRAKGEERTRQSERLPEQQHVSVPQLRLVPQRTDRVHQVSYCPSFFFFFFFQCLVFSVSEMLKATVSCRCSAMHPCRWKFIYFSDHVGANYGMKHPDVGFNKKLNGK